MPSSVCSLSSGCIFGSKEICEAASHSDWITETHEVWLNLIEQRPYLKGPLSKDQIHRNISSRFGRFSAVAKKYRVELADVLCEASGFAELCGSQG